ncbi:MAG: CHAD domain-containing protein [Bryobacteraceae bacterium]
MNKDASIRWLATRSSSANAAARLPRLVSEFFAAGRALAAADSGPAQAHLFRIRTKRMRYTLELFRSCYGRGLGTRLNSLREIQQCLGEMNDFATIRRLSRRPAVEAFMDSRMASKIDEFRLLWRERFDRTGQERRWITYLRSPRPGQKRRPPVTVG